jgi:hypothetical protein
MIPRVCKVYNFPAMRGYAGHVGQQDWRGQPMVAVSSSGPHRLRLANDPPSATTESLTSLVLLLVQRDKP